MIKKLAIRRFKSLNSVSINVGSLNLFIGSNASGKSNFLDALRVIQGIGYGFTFREILDGKPKSSSSEVWEAIRGGSTMARFRDAKKESVSFSIQIQSEIPNHRQIEYKIAFNPLTGRLTRESLATSELPNPLLPNHFSSIYDTERVTNQNAESAAVRAWYNRPGKLGPKPHLEFDRSRPIICQLGRQTDVTEEHREVQQAMLKSLCDNLNLDPSPTVLRRYSSVASAGRMNEQGENFAAVVKTICESPKDKEAFVSWLRELRPAEVDDVEVLDGALNDSVFALREVGREKPFPAPVLSDGTLRFAAIAAAFFQPDMPAMLTIEEIEKGIHASRLRLLLELLKTQADRDHVQIMATTHSRSVLDWLEPADYASTFFCHRDTETGESRIVSVKEIPHLLEALKTDSLGDLYAENWMEAAV